MTDIEICTMALGNIGISPTSTVSLTAPVTKEDRACVTYYATARKKLLSMADWPFARRFAYVLEDTDTTDPEFSYCYVPPSDCVKVRRVDPMRVSVKADGDKWKMGVDRKASAQRLFCDLGVTSDYDTLRGVAWSSTLGLFCAVGDLGLVRTSPNGIDWTETSAGGNDLNAVCWDAKNSLFVLVGDGGAIYTSADGVTFTARTSGVTDNLYGVASDGSAKITAVGSGGAALYTTDCVTWTDASRSAISNDFNAVCWVGGSLNVFVAVGAGGATYTSPDAVTWTSETSGTTRDLRGVATNAVTTVAVGDFGTVLSSVAPTGTWTDRTSLSGTTAHLLGVGYGLSAFCIVGAAGTVVTSATGTSAFTARTSAAAQSLYGFAASTLEAVIAGGGEGLTRSTDLATWVCFAPDSVRVVYTADVSAALYPSEFCDALAWEVASRLTMPLRADPKTVVLARKMAQMTLEESYSLLANESREDAPPDAEAIRARS